MVQALIEELKQRKEVLDGITIDTIYFGGGTPSLLNIGELQEIIGCIYNEFQVSGKPEITLEANPDDLILTYVSDLNKSGINRLSIGVQSWDEEDLIKLNRKHSAIQAEKAINNALESGIKNISIDLIYGLPGMNPDKWKQNLKKAFSFNITHLSAYHLTYEAGNVMDYMRIKKRIKPVEEEESEDEFRILIQEAGNHRFKQYELSNFSKEGFESRHNSSYWERVHYLGIGPSAHSFIGKTRSWNISNNRKYTEGIFSGTKISESEVLSETEEFNEYIMTGFRMRKGIDMVHILKNFGEEKMNYFLKNIENYKQEGLTEGSGNRIWLTSKGMFLSDRIISDMMIVE